MKWASTLSTSDSIETCIDETTASMRKQLAGDEPHLTVVFISPHFQTITHHADRPTVQMRIVRDNTGSSLLPLRQPTTFSLNIQPSGSLLEVECV